ncbi:MAG: DNA primase [Bacteroidetes bacterium]|nr:MAG: DNA primase [Bacteroidota bacterium]
MISRETIQQIIETARVEEVVGDFVHLKKRGVNYIGLCPFHNEKTPSFTVSPAKGIYKCFGCGAGGNAVNFLIQHEHLSYPEALKWLAEKYNITIEEEQLTEEKKQELDERESLYAANLFALDFFQKQLQTDEGKSVAISYFHQRGISGESIEKFRLGYSPENRQAFFEEATENGFKPEILLKADLITEKNGKYYDKFASRIIFPIFNLSGRPIAFAGRTLLTNKKIPKYINSAETLLYEKNKVLYGIFQAKNAIVKNDNCYLVEGYTDVISLHQKGIENVVASSGTSLTEGQIRLISRYTKNITILYDGDFAGIKAATRGINMILSEGLNVKVVLFPEGEDPDSFAQNHSEQEVKEYISANASDFIVFKTNLFLQQQNANDPVQKAEFLKDIVQSVALIPDPITAMVYVQECSKKLNIPENIILQEVQIVKKKNRSKKTGTAEPVVKPIQKREITPPDLTGQKAPFLEKELCRILLNYGNEVLNFPYPDENSDEEKELPVYQYIVENLLIDELELEIPPFNTIFNYYKTALEKGKEVSEKELIYHSDSEVSKMAVNLVSFPYNLHNWKKQQIYVTTEHDNLKHLTLETLRLYKILILEKYWENLQEELKNCSDFDRTAEILSQLNIIKKELAKLYKKQGISITR